MTELTLIPPAREALTKGIALGKIRRESGHDIAAYILATAEHHPPEIVAKAQQVISPELEATKAA